MNGSSSVTRTGVAPTNSDRLMGRPGPRRGLRRGLVLGPAGRYGGEPQPPASGGGGPIGGGPYGPGRGAAGLGIGAGTGIDGGPLLLAAAHTPPFVLLHGRRRHSAQRGPLGLAGPAARRCGSVHGASRALGAAARRSSAVSSRWPPSPTRSGAGRYPTFPPRCATAGRWTISRGRSCTPFTKPSMTTRGWPWPARSAPTC